MEFVKRNCAKLTFALISLIGVVFVTMLLIDGPVREVGLLEYADGMYNSNLYMLLAQLLFFVSLFTYFVLSMFDQTKAIGRYVLLGLSVVTLVLIVLSMTSGAPYLEHAKEVIAQQYELVNLMPEGAEKAAHINGLQANEFALTLGVYTKILNILVFALMPLVYSVKKVLKARNQ